MTKKSIIISTIIVILLSSLIVVLLFIIETKKKETPQANLSNIIQDINSQSKNINDQINNLPKSESNPNAIIDQVNSNNYTQTKSGGQLIALNFFDYNKPEFKDILDKIPEIKNNFDKNTDLQTQYVFSNAGVYRLLSTDYSWIGVDQTEQSELWYAIKDGFLYKTEPNLINPKIALSFPGEKTIVKKVKLYPNYRKAFIITTTQSSFYSGKVKLAVLDLDAKDSSSDITNQQPFTYNDLENLYSKIKETDSIDPNLQSAIQSATSIVSKPYDRSSNAIEGFEDEPPTFSIDDFYAISPDKIVILSKYNTYQLWIATIKDGNLSIDQIGDFKKIRTNNTFLNCDKNNICYIYNLENNEIYNISIIDNQITFNKKTSLLSSALSFAKFDEILKDVKYQKDLFLVNLNQNLYIQSKSGLIQLL
jgi:hypothetical protein